MIYTENAINVLTAKTYKGIGKAWIIKYLHGEEDIKEIVELLNKDVKGDNVITVNSFNLVQQRIKEKLEKLATFVDGFVAIGDANFPPYRGNVKNAERPILLFYRGDLALLGVTSKNVAIIGLLDPDIETKIIEQKVVTEFVKNGFNIISGLALGCDTIAHKQALNTNGKTVAILPSSLNNILPAINKQLANEIVKKDGLIVTEYYEEVRSKMELNGRYQERDRLQALFSDAVVLSASYAKNDLGNDSGSRLAMEYALNYSIPRAVIYESEINCNNSKYDLTRQLIEEDKEIIIINKKTISNAIKEINSKKPINNDSRNIQIGLFH